MKLSGRAWILSYGLASIGALVIPSAQADVLPENRALLAFKRAQIAEAEQLARTNAGVGVPELETWIRNGRLRANQIENATGDAAAVSLLSPEAALRVEERAYFAKDDGSPQPYWIALPRDYSPAKKWPLIVFLHGYAPSISKLSPWILDLDTLTLATSQGAIVAMPYGRRNADFVQWGQDDVIAVKRECEHVYSLDTSRIYLMGTSMGGYGAYAVGLHKPDEWAAVAPIAGRTDFYRWFKINRTDLPAWKQVLYDADDPRTLEENGRATPFFFQHGAADITVPVEHSRLFAADATRLRLPYKYEEVPNVGHEDLFQVPAIVKAITWLNQQPARLAPRKLSFTTGDLREARTDWVQVEALGTYDSIGRIDAEIDGATIDGATLKVQTNNITRFTLDLKTFALGQVALEVNGTKVGDVDTTQPVSWSAPDAQTGKSPTCCGPFKSLMRDSFLLVYGNSNDRKDAQKFAQEWYDCTDGQAMLKEAGDVSDLDKRNCNLILFGTRDSNRLLREIADQLPVELVKGGYRVGSTVQPQKGCGLRMVWHSPWASERLVGVCSGAWWGEKLPLNHKWDLLPDYIVYQSDARDKDDTNHALVAGDFDGDWKIKAAPAVVPTP